MTDDQLRDLLGAAAVTSGWGTTRVVSVGPSAVFAKTVPVTKAERADLDSTRNLYDLPAYLNYPFGSPGLGIGRELASAIKTTRWVTSEHCLGFPMLIHHRMMSRTTGDSNADPQQRFVGATTYLGNEPTMNAYLADRASADHELLMLFEHLPHTAADWLIERPGDIGWIVEDVRQTIAFMRHHEIIHFDTDFFNIVTDGRRAYLTDFGLVLDRQFDLTDDERRFFDRNRHYDDGNLLLSVAHQLHWMYRRRPADDRASIDTELGLDDTTSFEESVERLIVAADDLDASGRLPIGPEFVGLLDTHRPAIKYMHSFFTEARQHWTDQVTLDDQHLQLLLRRSGYLAG